MPIPDYQTLMLPLLNFAADEQEHSLREAIESLADQFQLSEEDRKELLPSGQQAKFDNRVGWARTYLKKAGLLEGSRRGYFKATERGRSVLASGLQRIDQAYLRQFPEFLEFQNRSRGNSDEEVVSSDVEPNVEMTPEETIESAHQRLRENLANELLQTIKGCSPNFFERLVVDLLLKMGYGGTRRDAGKAIGKSGDGGIDGVINEDRLGLDAVYIQAKRWEGSVGRPEIQKFVGALQGQRARKGIFITTSSFTREAFDYAGRIESKVILIDGEQLAQYMIDFNVGVSVIANYELKKVDQDYFTDEL